MCTTNLSICDDHPDKLLMAMEHRECVWTRYDYLFVFSSFHTTEGLCVGVHIELNRRILEDNDLVNITDIGENDAAVLCRTDRLGCCKRDHGGDGEWYFPNNERVGTIGRNGSFYRNRDQGVVRLNRRYNAMMPTGLFCCEIPDTNGINRTICIMVEASTITPHGV